ENKVDFILAVGGGSVIDSAKAISIGCNYEGDVWDFFEGKAKPDTAIPIGVVLTIPAAGSESSVVTVITNEDGLIKRGFHSDSFLPKFAILNPELTMTLPLFQIACGAADILAHTFERYFTPTKNRDLTDRLCEGLMLSVVKNAEEVLSKGKPDYDSMAELMWASTIAHNGILGTGRKEDWASHKFGHELSALFGITHGASLSIMFPAWMKYVYKNNLDLFVQFAERIFSVDTKGLKKEEVALKGINCLEKFFSRLGLPTRLSDIKVDLNKIDEMSGKIVARGPVGNLVKLDKEDAIEIYKLAI
ncbi:MAG: iron-containing alcohol dehydrogenase, partial [Actinomycetota bacterium]|nr:iron-containing alcohol dehydrogenase [Actinomycetota bacterium]